ncbi:hypothetical protein DPMN_031585 [Dreissena polymorpha]|uniref:Uncharacterized protein n=1 Tax=Dreissena polymorpha TaxID=45954 RepID=A0A9D4RI63_DREPO|nr:hypothetical protein DPMN_031585 [Dreissena polymorpha]
MLNILFSAFTQRHCRRAGHSVLYIHTETLSSCWTFCTLHSHRDTVVMLDSLYSTFTQRHCRRAGHSVLYIHTESLSSCWTLSYSTFTQSHAGYSVLYIPTESCWTFCTLHSHRDTVVMLDILYSTFTQRHCRRALHSVLYIHTKALSSC